MFELEAIRGGQGNETDYNCFGNCYFRIDSGRSVSRIEKG